MLITRLLLVLEVCDGIPTYRKSCAGNLLVWSHLTLGPPLQGQTRIAKLKSAYYSLIIGPRGLGWYTNIEEIMCWESSGVVRFDLGPLLQGQTRIGKHKNVYNSLIIGPRGFGWYTNI